MELTSNLERRGREMEHRQSINFRLYGESEVAGSIHKGRDDFFFDALRELARRLLDKTWYQSLACLQLIVAGLFVVYSPLPPKC